MGEAHYEPPAPNEFLRKNARQGIFQKRVKSAIGHRKYSFKYETRMQFFIKF